MVPRILALCCVALAVMCLALAVLYMRAKDETACWRGLAEATEWPPEGACGR